MDGNFEAKQKRLAKLMLLKRMTPFEKVHFGTQERKDREREWKKSI